MKENEVSKHNKQRGYLIASKRIALGYTQETLGKMLNVTGSTVSKWERGENSPQLEDALRLCEILDIPIGYIFTGTYSVQKTWRKPYVPEGCENIDDIFSTEYDIKDRVPKFLIEEGLIPDDDMFDYLRFSRLNPDWPSLAMQIYTGYKPETVYDVEQKWIKAKEKYPECMDKDYWMNVVIKWNPESGYPAGDSGYHRWVIDNIVEKATKLSMDAGLWTYNALKRADEGVVILGHNETHSGYYDKANILIKPDTEDILYRYFNVYTRTFAHMPDSSWSEEEIKALDSYDPDRSHIVAYKDWLDQVETSERGLKKFLKRTDEYGSDIDITAGHYLYACGLTERGKELKEWFEQTHPWVLPDYKPDKDRWAS